MKTFDKFFITPDWPAPSHVKAYVSLRAGNFTQPDDKTLNKSKLKELLQLPTDPIWVKQTHSDIALPAHTHNLHQEADALFADKPNQVCAILTADCLPVLICDRKGKHVAAIHAGWRGLAKGVIEKTLAALNLKPSDVMVWLGPAIGPNKFIVREDVYNAFTQDDEEAKLAFQPINSEQWLADLYRLARLRLNRLNISQIYGGNSCTHTQEDKFFSYRRDGKILGHIVSVIWLADYQ